MEARQKLITEAKPNQVINDAIKGYKARKEVIQLREQKQLKEEQAKEQAGKVITKAAQKYRANKEKKAWVQKAKAVLEAEIASLQEEMKAGSRPQKEPKSSVKSKAISKAFESVTDFWLADTTKEAAKQGKKDTRQAKKDSQKDAEDKLSAKAKALQERRKQLEAQ